MNKIKIIEGSTGNVELKKGFELNEMLRELRDLNDSHANRFISSPILKKYKPYNIIEVLRNTEFIYDKEFFDMLLNKSIVIELGITARIKNILYYFFGGLDAPTELTAKKYQVLTLGEAYAIYGNEEMKSKLIDSEIFPIVAYLLFKYGSDNIRRKIIEKIVKNEEILNIAELALEQKKFKDFIESLKQYNKKYNY
ncbi:MAG: hypothetical protein ACP5UN_01270 [Candidatus Micrarchaeia archaeon]